MIHFLGYEVYYKHRSIQISMARASNYTTLLNLNSIKPLDNGNLQGRIGLAGKCALKIFISTTGLCILKTTIFNVAENKRSNLSLFSGIISTGKMFNFFSKENITFILQ